MSHGSSSQQIRQRAVSRFIEPARSKGLTRFQLPIKLLMRELESEGFPKNRPAQFCAAVQKEQFRDEQGFEIERVDGPPSGKSTTVVFYCKFKGTAKPEPRLVQGDETPAERAFRVTENLRGLLKEEIAAFGGAEAYLRWVRGEDEE